MNALTGPALKILLAAAIAIAGMPVSGNMDMADAPPAGSEAGSGIGCANHDQMHPGDPSTEIEETSACTDHSRDCEDECHHPCAGVAMLGPINFHDGGARQRSRIDAADPPSLPSQTPESLFRPPLD